MWFIKNESRAFAAMTPVRVDKTNKVSASQLPPNDGDLYWNATDGRYEKVPGLKAATPDFEKIKADKVNAEPQEKLK